MYATKLKIVKKPLKLYVKKVKYNILNFSFLRVVLNLLKNSDLMCLGQASWYIKV